MSEVNVEGTVAAVVSSDSEVVNVIMINPSSELEIEGFDIVPVGEKGANIGDLYIDGEFLSPDPE